MSSGANSKSAKATPIIASCIDRAERRLNNLGYFKKVKITNEPGSTPDRVIVVVDVEDQPTGSLSLSGGYSTTDGFIADVAVTETNFMGRGQYVKLAVSEGQYSRGINFSFTEPYFLGERIAAGFDVYAKKSDAWQYSVYNNFMTGGTLRLGLPVTEEITFSPRYSIYTARTSPFPTIPGNPYNDCNIPIFGITPGFNGITPSLFYNCLTNGEASLALKEAQGPFLTSMVGYTLGYNSLDNNRSPTAGLFAELRQDIAGAGGDDTLRSHHRRSPLLSYLIRSNRRARASARRRSCQLWRKPRCASSTISTWVQASFADLRRWALVPRDISSGNPQGNPLGGTVYYGGSLEVQFPIYRPAEGSRPERRHLRRCRDFVRV